MLKTSHEGKLWFVTQPDHALISGYLAAHWGNDQFARPGHYADTPRPERLRAEVILAVTQHDNGWWEWEALPQITEYDGFPAGLGDVLKDQQEGMRRWRVGLARFPNALYANLLISHHAYWLYAARTQSSPDPAFTHPLFWLGSPGRLYHGDLQEALDFVAEIEELQRGWIEKLRSDPERAAWVEPESLLPHARLLQLFDGLSLSLCSSLIPASSGESAGMGSDEFELRDTPRRGWNDRVTLRARPATNGRVVLDPYPFDRDPLPVSIPARVFDASGGPKGEFHTWWNATPLELVRFEYCS